jgi:hypothetical protein
VRSKLPGWVIDNRASVRREAEPYRELTPEQGLAILDSLCQDAMHLLASRADREKVLEYRDRLPLSSQQALRRLRESAKSRARQIERDE